jgi:hypothetical protein
MNTNNEFNSSKGYEVLSIEEMRKVKGGGLMYVFGVWVGKKITELLEKDED